ncbi:hypothetical protein C8J56DRAFT_784272, partial [Mycena floridula]
RNIMRDNMIVCISGQNMAIDMNIEHLIGYVKKLYAGKGIHAGWEHLGHISACIKHLMALKSQVGKEMEVAHQGKSHTTPDTSALVWRVFDNLAATKLQNFLPTWAGNSQSTAFTDLHFKGHQQLLSASLATFNKKMTAIKQGMSFDPELDEIAVISYHDMETGGDVDNDDD